MEPCTFQPKLKKKKKKKKKKKSTLRNIFYFRTSRNKKPENLLFSKKKTLFIENPFNILKNRNPEKNYLYFRKQNFLIFQERYIQNPAIITICDIFRTLSNIYDGTFCKHSYPAHF